MSNVIKLGKLLTAKFSIKNNAIIKSANVILNDVNTDIAVTRYRAQYSVSDDGNVLVYDRDIPQSLVKFVVRGAGDLSDFDLNLASGNYGMFSVSKTRPLIAVGTNEIESEIRLISFVDKSSKSLKVGEQSAYPIWSPDDKYLAFASLKTARFLDH